MMAWSKKDARAGRVAGGRPVAMGLKRVLAFAGIVVGSVISAAEPVPALAPRTNVVTLKADFSRNRLYVPVQVNDAGTRTFLLDTGYGITMVSPDLVTSLGLTRLGSMTIVGIAGEESAGTYGGVKFEFGGLSHAPRRVASLPSEPSQQRRRRAGILGADFFQKFVVELNPAAGEVRLYEPGSFKYSGSGEILPLQFPKDTPVVAAAIERSGRTPVSGRFEIDTGCDDGLCLGWPFVQTNGLLANPATGPNSTKSGVGGGAEVYRGRVDGLQLGKVRLARPSTSYFLAGSPAGTGLAGHVGMGALRQFRVIFDYSRRRMILEPLR